MTDDNPNTNFDGVVVPPLVLELAAGRSVDPVWVNQIGGVTYAIDGGAEYVKYGPPHDEFDPDPEFARLRWVSAFVNAPRPIDHGVDGTGNRWLRTVGHPGDVRRAGRLAQPSGRGRARTGPGLATLP